MALFSTCCDSLFSTFSSTLSRTQCRSFLSLLAHDAYDSLNHVSILSFLCFLLSFSVASIGLWLVMTTPVGEETVDSNPSSTHSPDRLTEKQHVISRWNRRRSALTKRNIVLLIAIPCLVVGLALALGLGLGLGLHHTPKATPLQPIVDLGYATYQGSNSSGIAQWLGMRYAAVPTGKLRFSAPAPPSKLKGVQSATKVR